MTEKNNGGPAFPCVDGVANIYQPGMSLRDYFAAKAMQGISANPECNERTFDEISEISYRQADAMLKAREEK